MEAQRQSPASGLLSKLGDLRVANGSKGNTGSAPPYDEIVANLDNILPHWDRIKTGTLPNGLRYYIQPNTTPPNTFDAYLRVHVGSLAEEEDQQGIAHYVEHLVFMGTDAYPDAETMRKLFATWGMSFGGDTNAYTDFRSTVYTFHAPTHTQSQGAEKKEGGDVTEDNVYKVLFALHQLAFKALFPKEAVDSERGPILSEAQISNSIGYRVEYQEYQQIHADNLLSKRFPIGLVEQIKKWGPDDLRRFYRKWYRPDLMTLYIVGDVDHAQVQNHIESLFGKEVSEGETPKVPEHELLHQFSLTINHLFPLTNQRTVRDMRTEIICYVLMSTLEARVYALEQTYESPVFTSIEWSFFNSHSDNCSVSSLCMFARPTTWKEAIKCGVQEMVRMAKYGVTSHELERYMAALIKEAHQDAEGQDTLKSSDLIEDLVDDTLLESVLVSPKDDYELVRRLAPTVTLVEVNHLARQTFCQTLRVANLLRDEDVMAWEEEEQQKNGPADAEGFASSLEIIEKSRGISVFVTCPTLYSPDEETPVKANGGKDDEEEGEDDEEEDGDMDEEEDGEDDEEDDDDEDDEEEDEEDSTPEECQAKHQHKFIHSRTAQLVEKEVKENQKSDKEGGQTERKKIPFRVTKEEIRQVIEQSMQGVEAPKDIEVPQDLIADDVIQRKLDELKPTWVPVTYDTTKRDTLDELQKQIDSAKEQSDEANGGMETENKKTKAKKPTQEESEDDDDDEEDEDGEMDEEDEGDSDEDDDDDDEEDDDEDEGQQNVAAEAADEARRKRRKAEPDTTPRLIHKPSGIVLLELSNGIRVNYLYSAYFQKRCAIRITSVGGQLCERTREDAGLTQLALDTMQQSGAGPHSSEVVVAWCGRWGVEASAEATLETTCLHVGTSVSQNGISKALQLIHMLLTEPRWDERAWKRIRTHAASCREGEEKEIDNIAADNLSSILYQPTDWRFAQPSASDLRNASAERARWLVSHQLLDMQNVEVSLAGHFDNLRDVEDLLLKYLGTIPRRTAFAPLSAAPPPLNPFSAHLALPAAAGVAPGESENFVLELVKKEFPSRINFTDEARVKWQHLSEDEERRAIVYLCFPVMNRWGYTKLTVPPAEEAAACAETAAMETEEASPVAAVRQRVKQHPLWKSRVANLMVEILSNRLFSVVRERKGLLYNVSASLRMPDLYDSGTLHVTLTPFPDSIALTIEEALRVLYDFKHGNITQQELDEAKVPYLEWLITAMKGPTFWMSLMEYMQLPEGIFPRDMMNLSCAEDIYEAYAAVELPDIRAIVNEFFQGMRVMCASIGTSGTEPPASMEEQRQRVQNAVSSFPVPPVTPPAPVPAADATAP
ncbi:peptidase M16 inactive domain containing protein [Acanthamoeba castellanii str. Neff]|uniref:Peptidase M16 inactive domain containing protein n=1 Tax=Acanthamoeba castellanii (strain ATCC 30010 / Neff) TaxID=1257118 RepID=L8HGW3_ACACF|nr:peptidase M16 inactive domain containing protein [Acanthamoeba castellanii str. Neff]ELR23661.1 peptidase M16 inactive domain containing protein [Acanthamoeba castellanii str. Neff]